MAVYRVEGLPDDPLAAAAQFHAEDLPRIAGLADEGNGELTIVFASADHTHRSWRLAVVESLARDRAPRRVNAIAADSDAAIAAALFYLARAPGVTGQYWPLDAEGAMGA